GSEQEYARPAHYPGNNNPSTDWGSCTSIKLTANPPGKRRLTRPTTFPTASTVPISGALSADTATPEAEKSVTRQLMIAPSAKSRVENGYSTAERGCVRRS